MIFRYQNELVDLGEIKSKRHSWGHLRNEGILVCGVLMGSVLVFSGLVRFVRIWFI